VARSLPLLLLCLILPLAADGVDVQAATVITQESTAPRWRLVAGPEVSAPRSTVIPAQMTGLQREVAGTAQKDATLPADAQVAAAPIRRQGGRGVTADACPGAPAGDIPFRL